MNNLEKGLSMLKFDQFKNILNDFFYEVKLDYLSLKEILLYPGVRSEIYSNLRIIRRNPKTGRFV